MAPTTFLLITIEQQLILIELLDKTQNLIIITKNRIQEDTLLLF